MKDITNDDVIKAWSNTSTESIEAHGDEGDFARQHLLNPAIFALLGEDIRGKTILDAGCGQGYLCRLLAKRGALVTGVEPAENLYRYALAREQSEQQGIRYLQDDLSTLRSFKGMFDYVIANMVFMDIPDYETAVLNCIVALKQGGGLIFSILHPCFEESAQEWTNKGYVEVREYFEERTYPSNTGYWFHRPLSTYLNLVRRGGCMLQEMIEPRLSDEMVQYYGEQHARNAYVPQFIVMYATKAVI